MIRHTATMSELRMFEADDPAPMAPFDACCVLAWETPNVVWMRMLKGRMSRKLLGELTLWFAQHDVVTVKAHRAAGHRLPLAREQPDGSFVMVVAEVAARLGLDVP